MIDAICIIDELSDKVISIFEFKALPESEIDRLRYSLLCTVCKQKAYFRKASSDGKQACFGSRYHKDDCEEFNPSIRKSEEEKQIAELEALLLEADSLQIDFSLPVTKKKIKKKEKATTDKPTLPVKKNALTKQSGLSINKQGTNKRNINKQCLKKLLVSLLRGSSLASSDLWIYTSEKHKWRAKNLFVNINEAKTTENGAPRMYWGTISHADKTLSWLNPAEERSVSIPINKFQAEFLARFDIQEARDIEGAGFIMFAKCIESKNKKRKYLQLWGNDLSYFYISKAED
jgi:hypothetical protein